MTQPTDRLCRIPQIGEVDEDAGEFWIENPLMIPQRGENLSAFERNAFFMNVAGKDFINGSFASSIDIDSDSRSVVPADFDGDGAVDLMVGSVGGGPLRVFRNQLRQGNRLNIRLRGTTSNRSGIGARLVARIGDRQVVRDAIPHNGFMALGPPEVWIGAGDADKIDALTIRWPTGKIQEFRNIELNRRVTITEGNDRLQSSPLNNLAQ